MGFIVSILRPPCNRIWLYSYTHDSEFSVEEWT